jgi:hypothetical protein
MKIVTVRELATGRVFDRDATRVAMELPSGWPDDAVVLVAAGDEVEWVRPGRESLTRRSHTRRLEQFFDGERCLVPSKGVSTDGRTLWHVVEVVTAIHIGERPSDE